MHGTTGEDLTRCYSRKRFVYATLIVVARVGVPKEVFVPL